MDDHTQERAGRALTEQTMALDAIEALVGRVEPEFGMFAVEELSPGVKNALLKEIVRVLDGYQKTRPVITREKGPQARP